MHLTSRCTLSLQGALRPDVLLELLHCIKALLNAMLGAAQRLDQESCRLLSIMHHQVGMGRLLSILHHQVGMGRPLSIMHMRCVCRRRESCRLLIIMHPQVGVRSELWGRQVKLRVQRATSIGRCRWQQQQCCAACIAMFVISAA